MTQILKIEPYATDNTANFVFNGLTVTSNISSGNANLGNVVTANYYYGNGINLTGLIATNSNFANYAGNVTISNQPNITGLGTLGGLNVIGITSLIGNVSITGNFNVTGNTNYINSNVVVIEDPVIQLGGGANAAALTSNDSLDRGTLLHYYTTTTVDAFMGWKAANGEFTFASNASLSSGVVSINTLGNIRAGSANLGNSVTSNYFIGAGNNLSNIQGANVTGTVANATYAISASSAATASTVTSNAQPNITSVGTLNGLTSTATVNFTGASNVSLGAVGNVKITGGSASQYLQTDGSGNLSWVTLATLTTISNGTSNLTIPVSGGNVNISTGGNANVLVVTTTGVNVSGTLNATGNANVGNIGASAGLFTTVTGTLTTQAQPNITSLGTLSNLVVNGNTTLVGNLIVTGNTTYVNSNVTDLQDPLIQLGTGANGATLLSNLGVDIGTVLNYYNTAAQSAFIGWKTANADFEFVSNATVNSNNVITVNTLGNIRAGNANLGNTVTANYTNAVLTTSAQPNITSTGTLSSLTVSGLITATGSGLKVANIQDTSGTISLTTKYGGTAGDIGITGNLTVGTSGTGNITSSNANLGNAVTANYFVGSGAYVTSVAAVTAATVTASAQPNITSVGTLANLIVGNATANTTMGNGTITASGNISFTGANVSLGAVGNLKITGGSAGYFLSTDGAGNLSWGSASGGGGVSASGSNTQIQYNNNGVLGASANLTFTNTSNTLTVDRAVLVNGANLGINVANVYIGGGSANQILKTDGVGNLSWVQQPVATITVDNFTGDGTTTAFTLSVTPTSINQTIVNYNGVFQLRTSAYTISGSTITFTEAPLNGSKIEVTTTLGGISGAGAFTNRTYTGTGSQTAYTVTNGVTASSLLVTENGVVQTPGTDYTVSGSTLTFTTAPTSAMTIQIRELSIPVATSSVAPITVQNQGTNLTTSTSLINFTGSGVTATNSGSNVTVTVSGSGSGTSNARAFGFSLVFGG